MFKCHKFRSMTVAPKPPKGGTSNWSSVSVAGDSKITPFGATLRHYKLDELPELWDVLIGNMSFVGPRPDVPGYADALVGDDREVLKLRPGITGPATVLDIGTFSCSFQAVVKACPRPSGLTSDWTILVIVL